jgi:hypothetical protein
MEVLTKIPEDTYTPSEIIFHLVDNSYNLLNEFELMAPFISSCGSEETKEDI